MSKSSKKKNKKVSSIGRIEVEEDDVTSNLVDDEERDSNNGSEEEADEVTSTTNPIIPPELLNDLDDTALSNDDDSAVSAASSSSREVEESLPQREGSSEGNTPPPSDDFATSDSDEEYIGGDEDSQGGKGRRQERRDSMNLTDLHDPEEPPLANLESRRIKRLLRRQSSAEQSKRLEMLEELDMVKDQVAWCVGQGLLDQFGQSVDFEYTVSDDGMSKSSDTGQSNQTEGERKKSRRKPRRSIATRRKEKQKDKHSLKLTSLADSGLLEDALNDSEDLASLFHDVDLERAEERKNSRRLSSHSSMGSCSMVDVENERKEAEEIERRASMTTQMPISELDQLDEEEEAEVKEESAKSERRLSNARSLVVKAFSRRASFAQTESRRHQLASEIMQDADDDDQRSVNTSLSRASSTSKMSKPVGFSAYDQHQNLHQLQYRDTDESSILSGMNNGNISMTTSIRKRWMWVTSVLLLCGCATLVVTMLVLQNDKSGVSPTSTQQKLLQREANIDKDLQNMFSWFGRSNQQQAENDDLDKVLKSFQGLRHNEENRDTYVFVELEDSSISTP